MQKKMAESASKGFLALLFVRKDTVFRECQLYAYDKNDQALPRYFELHSLSAAVKSLRSDETSVEFVFLAVCM